MDKITLIYFSIIIGLSVANAMGLLIIFGIVTELRNRLNHMNGSYDSESE